MDVSALIKDTHLREAGKRLLANSASQHPLHVNLQVTYRCQANCSFCPYALQFIEGDVNSHFTFLHDAEKGSYVDILASLNPVTLSITGGEPLLRDDLTRIIHESKYVNGIPFVQLITNGAQLTPERMKSIAGAGVDAVAISMDYASQKHSVMRGIPHLYETIQDRLSDLVEKASDHHVALRFSTIIMRDNLEDIPLIIDKAKQHEMQVALSPYSPGRNKRCDLMPAADDSARLDDLFAYLTQIPSSLLITTPAELKLAYSFLNGVPRIGCTAGQDFMYITPSGNIKPCPDKPNQYTSLAKASAFLPIAKKCGDCAASCRTLAQGVGEALREGNLPALFEYAGCLLPVSRKPRNISS